MKREPVLIAQVSAAIMAILSLLVALGVIQIGGEQMAEIEQAVGAVLTILIPLLMAIWARGKVTPVEDARDNAGRQLAPLEPPRARSRE